jgi:TonB family protein
VAHPHPTALIIICLVGITGCSHKDKSDTTAQQLLIQPPKEPVIQEPMIVVFGDDKVRIRFQPPPPPYPPEAKKQRIEGVVSLRLHITRAGKVSSIEYLSGPEELRSAAESHAKGYEFIAEPGAFSPSTGEAQFTLNCRFQLKGQRTQ